MGNRSAMARREDLSMLANMRRELAALEAMTVGELAEKYHELFGVPTRTRNRDYLRRRLAWRIQEQKEGGLSPRALERIEQLAPKAPALWRRPVPRKAGVDPTAPSNETSPRDLRLPTPGTIMTRLYNGIEHRVTILDDGFEYKGERHRSLSRVAKLITGTPWNGFRFFFGNARGGNAARGER
jgi:hypothetical protein